MTYRRLELERCDPDELVGVIDGTEMHHRLLPGGALTVRLERAHLAKGSIQRGRYGMGVLAQGALPPGVITVGGMLRSPADTVINGFLCPPVSLQLYSEHCELNYRAARDTTWFAYCVERAALQDAAIRLCGQPLRLPEAGARILRLPPPVGRRLAACIQSVFAAMARQPSGEARDEVEAALQLDIASALAGDGSMGACARDMLHVEQRRRLMARAEDYLRAHLAQPFNLDRFARAVGVSHRMLEYHFRRTFGVTPIALHRSMRLDAVRRDLRLARRRGETVTTIAMRWGFTHFGRFSEEYRILYGERPVDTLRRA